MYRWVNDSVPFAGAAFRQWIVEFYQENRLAMDTLVMDGRPVRFDGPATRAASGDVAAG